MIRPTKLWFGVAAFAITIAALLAIVALAMRVSPAWHLANGLAITMPILTAFFCAFLGIVMHRRRTGQPDPASTSIQDELDSRKLRANGTRIQLR